ncbi:DUF4238 domain-containing protein [Hyphomonas atlantica corrig.]|uniref:DUF4238 domain-containing protein n=1 Tax=Hyphomonas atlantica TaxID=1280948 RepID=UPI00235549EF|nr:DUF4238 domain-containing protein [Hyphomonas atlantica]
MSNSYKHNHYVPEWYQKRFLEVGKDKFYYLDLDPETIVNNGHAYKRRSLLRWAPSQCFAQDDLYTTRLGEIENRDIEKFFFGQLDTLAPKAVHHFANFEFGGKSEKAFHNILRYMSVQKLRTPKGLAWLRNVFNVAEHNTTLYYLQKWQNLFCATWTECVWQIADASKSSVKFIISDHPVVAYSRECFPNSKYCIGDNDPDIRYVSTHTYFPLSLEKILILTNLSWVRDPYQNPLKVRPNPDMIRPSMFHFMGIQHERYLSEEEVMEINYITKRRARRFIASSKEEWLYPEHHLRSTNWRKLGDGYLLMPDPRHINAGGEIIIGYNDGTSEAFSEYGHRPWQRGYKDSRRNDREWKSMEKFKAEWSAMFGPSYRGVVYDHGPRGTRYKVGDKYHAKECELDAQIFKQPGERSRRRKLRRK